MKHYNLLVVAHPDDETIFFGGVVQVFRRHPWKIVCVTDGNADGEGARRAQDFRTACHALRAKECEMLDFADRYETRLDVERLAQRLAGERPVMAFTHGALGEYGHPHHQDVCLAVHRAFAGRVPVWSPAYNAFAEKVFRVPRKAYEKKCEILSRTYFSETHRFARQLPAANHEGFQRLELAEVEALYAYLAAGRPLEPARLKQYAWFTPYLEEFRRQIAERPF